MVDTNLRNYYLETYQYSSIDSLIILHSLYIIWKKKRKNLGRLYIRTLIPKNEYMARTLTAVGRLCIKYGLHLAREFYPEDLSAMRKKLCNYWVFLNTEKKIRPESKYCQLLTSYNSPIVFLSVYLEVIIINF